MKGYIARIMNARMDKSFVSDFIIHMGLGEGVLSLIYIHWEKDQPYM